MKYVPLIAFAAGALTLAIHLISKLVTGYGTADAMDAAAILVLAGVAKLVLPTDEPSAPDTPIR